MIALLELYSFLLLENTHLHIKFRSSLSLRFACFYIFDIKKSDVLSAKIFHVDTILSGRSFTHIIDRSGLKTEPWETPAKMRITDDKIGQG